VTSLQGNWEFHISNIHTYPHRELPPRHALQQPPYLSAAWGISQIPILVGGLLTWALSAPTTALVLSPRKLDSPVAVHH